MLYIELLLSVVGFSVVKGEVNSDLLEFCAVVGWGGVICECPYMIVSNILGVGDGNSILPIPILLSNADVFTRYFSHSISHMLNRSISRKLENIFCPWLAFVPVKESPGLDLCPQYDTKPGLREIYHWQRPLDLAATLLNWPLPEPMLQTGICVC